LALRIDFHPKQDVYDRIMLCVIIASAFTRLIWLDKPAGSLIFDETYYVNAARIILGLPHDPGVYRNAASGLDPNYEHPPLGKLIIAFSMMILGDNGYGWRMPSVVLGVLSIFVFYLLMKKVSTTQAVPLLGASLLSLDNLFFVHSRIATLDIYNIAFMLLGFYWYFSDRVVLSAIAMALSSLSKITALFGVATIAVYYIGIELEHRLSIDLESLLAWLERYLVIYAGTFLALLAVMDMFWALYKNPFEHLSFIFSYHLGVVAATPTGIASYPWQWLLNEVKIPYLSINANIIIDGTISRMYPVVAFVGAMNPFIIYLTLPAIVYSIYSFYSSRSKATLFYFCWFTLTYLPFYPMSIIGHRIMYIFYFLNTIPAVCAMISEMIIDQELPIWLIFAYLGAVIAGFAMLFPFKAIPS
jgi:predicted membrane-bound dolichyl-phosphate-mannose-protein mannosyltransferase